MRVSILDDRTIGIRDVFYLGWNQGIGFRVGVYAQNFLYPFQVCSMEGYWNPTNRPKE